MNLTDTEGRIAPWPLGGRANWSRCLPPVPVTVRIVKTPTMRPTSSCQCCRGAGDMLQPRAAHGINPLQEIEGALWLCIPVRLHIMGTPRIYQHLKSAIPR